MSRRRTVDKAKIDRVAALSRTRPGHKNLGEIMHEGPRGPHSKDLKNGPVNVILFGCDIDLFRAARRHFPGRFECSNENSFSKLVETLDEGRTKQVIILGPQESSEGIQQLNALRLLKEYDRNLRVIYLTDSEFTNSAQIIAAGADDIVSQDRAKPRALSDRIGAILRLNEGDATQAHQPVFCEMRKGRLTVMERVSASGRINTTMDEFALSFDLHQRYNRHYAIMNAILTAYPHHFGERIIDLGCGTAHPMRQYIRNIMIPEFAAKPPKRGLTRILALDNTRRLLERAQIGYQNLFMQHPRLLEHQLDVSYLLADLMDVTSAGLGEIGFDRADTILASYIAHWVVDKEATVRRMGELLPVGGKLISIEEWPPVVTPGPHMSLEQAERIRASILPIERQDYYGLLRKHGFKDAKDGVVVLRIDKHHEMYGNVFQKIRAD